jgi:magnesium transporter
MELRMLSQPTPDGPTEQVDPSRFAELVEAGTWAWLDIAAPDRAYLDEVQRILKVDPSGIEDVLDIELLPKIEDFGDHLLVILHALVTRGDRVDTAEMDVILTDKVVVTIHDEGLTSVDALWDVAQSRRSTFVPGDPSWVLARLCELIGRRFLDVLVELDRRIEDVGDRALEADSNVLAEVQVLRREAATVRTMLRPQRHVLRALEVSQPSLVTARAATTFGDAVDIHDQLVESLETSRSLLADVLDTYRGTAGEKLAEITTLLTVYAAIMLPLTLVVGYFGMNLPNLPLQDTEWGWLGVTAFMLIGTALSWTYFVSRGFVRATGVRAGGARIARGLAGAVRLPVRSQGSERSTD